MSQTSLNPEYDDPQSDQMKITLRETFGTAEDPQLEFEQTVSFSAIKKIDEHKKRLTKSMLKPHSFSEFEVMFQAGQSISDAADLDQ